MLWLCLVWECVVVVGVVVLVCCTGLLYWLLYWLVVCHSLLRPCELRTDVPVSGAARVGVCFRMVNVQLSELGFS